MLDLIQLFNQKSRSYSAWNIHGEICFKYFQGDSGSPLVIEDNILIGVMSVGLDSCDESKGPSLYTRITFYLDFITKVLENHPSIPLNLPYKLVVVGS